MFDFAVGEYYNVPVPDDVSASIQELRRKFEVGKCEKYSCIHAILHVHVCHVSSICKLNIISDKRISHTCTKITNIVDL